MMGGIATLAEKHKAEAREEARKEGKSSAEIDRAGKSAAEATYEDCGNTVKTICNGALKVIGIFN